MCPNHKFELCLPRSRTLQKPQGYIYQIQLMGRQIGLPNTLHEAYDDCMEEKYGYLVVDRSPHHVGLPRLWSHIFLEEDRIQYVKILI